jgi:NADH-quinone oxidoreductase subunit N
VQTAAVKGVLFYLAAYGMMNTGAFGVLLMLPAKPDKSDPAAGNLPPVATTAETFEDIAGQGRKHPLLGVAMAISCFSLIGLPLTVGFFGKFYLVSPAWQAGLWGLVVITMINAAISAAYYLKIVATLFLRPLPEDEAAAATEGYPAAGVGNLPLTAGVSIAVVATLFFGVVLPSTDTFSGKLGVASPSAVSLPVSPDGKTGVKPPAPATAVTPAPAAQAAAR